MRTFAEETRFLRWCKEYTSYCRNESLSSVEGTLSRGTRDQDLEGLQTLSERTNLRVYLEQKAEWSVQGECQAQKKTI